MRADRATGSCSQGQNAGLHKIHTVNQCRGEEEVLMGVNSIPIESVLLCSEIWAPTFPDYEILSWWDKKCPLNKHCLSV